jgi:uncharacterized membrane protein
VTTAGSGRLANLDFLGGDVQLIDVVEGSPVVVRANYYPAWRARDGDRGIALYSADGQLAFRAPRDGSYVVRLVYPRYRRLSILATGVFVAGAMFLWLWRNDHE